MNVERMAGFAPLRRTTWASTFILRHCMISARKQPNLGTAKETQLLHFQIHPCDLTPSCRTLRLTGQFREEVFDFNQLYMYLLIVVLEVSLGILGKAGNSGFWKGGGYHVLRSPKGVT